MQDSLATPLSRYQLQLESGQLAADQEQAKVVAYLQEIFLNLCHNHHQQQRWYWQLARTISSYQRPTPGLYLWGSVGCGKTHLVDLFYDCLPFKEKKRMHFHRFMGVVHDQLATLDNKSDPLKVIAKQFAKLSQVLCFDEFFVDDVTDAMILAGLFNELFANGLCLIATSNIHPQKLYANGVQRQRFLPTIALIEQHTKILHLDSGIDYRLRTLANAEIYHYPLDEQAHTSLLNSFTALAPQVAPKSTLIEIEHRMLEAVRCTDDVAWFNFNVLCGAGRSQRDYLEIAKMYHAILLSDVPIMGANNDDQARRFINLIDILYDYRVKLIISAAAAINKLYTKGKLTAEFQRTQSRLTEMQTHAYLATGHIA